MTKKAKYTALSRGVCPENISIVEKYNEDDYTVFEKNLLNKLKSHKQYDMENGLDNDLNMTHIKKLILEKQNGTCNICNCDLKLDYSANDDKQFSIDRINSKLGHLCSNIQVLCWGCNRAKQNRW